MASSASYHVLASPLTNFIVSQTVLIDETLPATPSKASLAAHGQVGCKSRSEASIQSRSEASIQQEQNGGFTVHTYGGRARRNS